MSSSGSLSPVIRGTKKVEYKKRNAGRSEESVEVGVSFGRSGSGIFGSVIRFCFGDSFALD